MSDLPNGWECVRLIDFVYSVPTGVPMFSENRKYISTGSINAKDYIPEGEYSYNSRPSRANRIAMKGDVFQARMQNTDKALVIKESLADQLFSTGFLQFRPIAKTYDSKLLFYFVKSDYFLKQRDEFATGSTQIALTDANAVNLKLIVPPLNEQRRIVAKLERLLHKVDACKERLDKIPAILKRFRQSILAAACSGRLTADWRKQNHDVGSAEELLKMTKRKKKLLYEQLHAIAVTESRKKPILFKENLEPINIDDLIEIPKTWIWERLVNIAHIQGGVTKGRKFKNRKTVMLPYLRVANVQDGFLDLSEIKEIEALPEDIEKYKLEDGDILFTEGGDRDKLGRGTVWRNYIKGCIHQNHIFRARPYHYSILSDYISLATKSDYARSYFFSNASQTVNLASINLTTLGNVPIAIPPQNEQHEIVRRVEALFKKAEEIEARYKKAKAFVNKLTQSILAKAFRGELVPQDPNDETASVLLESIKMERAKQEPKRKWKKVAHDA